MFVIEVIQGPMDRSCILPRERLLDGHVKQHRPHPLAPRTGDVAPDMVHDAPMSDAIQPGAKTAGGLQSLNRTKGLEPDLLENVKRLLLVSQELGHIVKQGPFHLSDKI